MSATARSQNEKRGTHLAVHLLSLELKILGRLLDANDRALALADHDERELLLLAPLGVDRANDNLVGLRAVMGAER